ncbi:MAG TPA: cytochrome C oxidase subunit IV family protein [Blastocatellia bacterium]|nr:cytochrome C oxidase subunit IV family protein [Blastocatellia bacterium]
MADHTHDDSHGHPENPIKFYIGVFALLMVMTLLTVFVAQFDLEGMFKDTPVIKNVSGALNALVALTIAVIKATAVIMIFMHVRWSSRLTQVIVVASVFWLLIMLSFTLSDYFTRGGWPTGLGEY